MGDFSIDIKEVTIQSLEKLSTFSECLAYQIWPMVTLVALKLTSHAYSFFTNKKRLHFN